MATGTATRQSNGTAHFPKWIWEWINVEHGEEIIYKDDEGKKGRFISFWKKETETIEEDNSTNKLDSTDAKDTRKKCRV